jgi:hypothetical protein
MGKQPKLSPYLYRSKTVRNGLALYKVAWHYTKWPDTIHLFTMQADKSC